MKRLSHKRTNAEIIGHARAVATRKARRAINCTPGKHEQKRASGTIHCNYCGRNLLKQDTK